jgi:hypothetical protein
MPSVLLQRTYRLIVRSRECGSASEVYDDVMALLADAARALAKRPGATEVIALRDRMAQHEPTKEELYAAAISCGSTLWSAFNRLGRQSAPPSRASRPTRRKIRTMPKPTGK